MRILNSGLLAVAGLLAFAAPALAQTPKLGFVDSQRILREAPGAEQVQQQLQQEMQRFESQAKALQDSVNRMMQDYQQRSAMMTADARQKREEEILQKRNEMSQQYAALEQQAAQRQNELIEPVMEQVQGVIDALRQEEGYAMIFDVAAGTLMSADSALDLTSKVIERLKSAGPPPTANNR